MSDREPPDMTADEAPTASTYADYAGEELLEQAQGNSQASLIATVAFLRDREIPVDEWAAALGRTFGLEWEDTGAWSAGEFLDAMLINYRSLGAEVVSADLQPDRAEAAIVRFPDPEQCERFGVEIDLVARFHDTAHAIAAACGVTWTWELEDAATARTRLLVTRAESA